MVSRVSSERLGCTLNDEAHLSAYKTVRCTLYQPRAERATLPVLSTAFSYLDKLCVRKVSSFPFPYFCLHSQISMNCLNCFRLICKTMVVSYVFLSNLCAGNRLTNGQKWSPRSYPTLSRCVQAEPNYWQITNRFMQKPGKFTNYIFTYLNARKTNFLPRLKAANVPQIWTWSKTGGEFLDSNNLCLYNDFLLSKHLGERN